MSPDKPTRDSATDTANPREMYDAHAGDEPAGGDAAGRRGDLGGEKDGSSSAAAERAELGGQAAGSGHSGPGREEKGGSTSGEKRHPHVTEGSDEARVQGSARGESAPVLPANAQGTDQVSTDESAQPIDEESMYDRRPDEDKNRPPSTQ